MLLQFVIVCVMIISSFVEAKEQNLNDKLL
jgi:hypothetical protein